MRTTACLALALVALLLPTAVYGQQFASVTGLGAQGFSAGQWCSARGLLCTVADT
jgi:UDP-N-acetylmuramoylalanine-D-glutamate ligase